MVRLTALLSVVSVFFGISSAKAFFVDENAVSGSVAELAGRFNERCDRTLTTDSLSAEELTEINKGQLVSRFAKQANGYEIGYVFGFAPYDAELAMGVYSSCGEHAGKNGLGEFIRQSKLTSDPNKNPFRVFYEQQVNWPYSNGKYTVENTLRAENGTYVLEAKLIESSKADFSPQYADGYVRMIPSQTGTLVIACNYMVPRTSSLQGTFNGMARDRIKESGVRLLEWIKRVSADSAKAQAYRDRLKFLLSQ